MGTKYSSQSASGYNATPPADDGSVSSSNKVQWSTIKTKLADVLKTLIDGINSALVTTLDTSARSTTGNDTAVAGDHWRTIQVNTASVTVTLSDAATMAAGYMVSIANQSSGDITVALATNTNTIDGVTNATPTVSTKEVRTYLVNAATTGYLTQNGVATASDTNSGKIQVAVQSDMETASSTTRAVSPGRQQFHPSAAKAWVVFDGTAANPITPAASYNVSGTVTKNGTGDYTIAFSTSFSSANYCAVVTTDQAVLGNAPITGAVAGGGVAAGSCRVNLRSTAGTATDRPLVSVAFFGDQ